MLAAACVHPSLDLNSASARPEPAVANAMVGMWSGTVFESEADPGTPFTLVQVRHPDGTVSGQLVFSGTRIPLTDVKAYMGHADVQTTMLYVHHVPQHDAAEKLSAALRTESTPLAAITAEARA